MIKNLTKSVSARFYNKFFLPEKAFFCWCFASKRVIIKVQKEGENQKNNFKVV